MANIGSPSEHQRKYMNEPSYLEGRFGLRPLSDLHLMPGVLGVARLVVKPAFAGESVNTFVYSAHEVSIEVVRAERSLWYSLSGDDWACPSAKTYSRLLGSLPTPLNRWLSLKETAKSAPSVHFAIINGQKFGTLDGVGYQHRIVDVDIDLYAEWDNPHELASNHVTQVLLVRAYNQVLEMCNPPGG